mmetsp:Transcript_10795/g.18928  ORF Transcript_10795/g.18928 Transcript_10795/m.18928 type:complete len:226 (+) Transcript_10795:36-713(+)
MHVPFPFTMQRALLVFTCWLLQCTSYQGPFSLRGSDNAALADLKQTQSDGRLLALLLAAFKPAAGFSVRAGWQSGLQPAGMQHPRRLSVHASENRARPLMQVSTISPTTTSPTSVTIQLDGVEGYRAKLDEATRENKVVVVTFHAIWCRKCRAVTRKLELFAAKWQDVEFCKLKLDKSNSTRDLFKEKGAIPYFEVIGGSRGVVDEFKAGQTWISRLEELFEDLL